MTYDEINEAMREILEKICFVVKFVIMFIRNGFKYR